MGSGFEKLNAECTSFTSVVMSSTGGLAHEVTYFYKCLASHLANKWGDEYPVMMHGLVTMLFIVLIVTLCYSMYPWCMPASQFGIMSQLLQ